MYNVELLTQAIEAVRAAEEVEPVFIPGDHRPYERISPKTIARQVADQVLILSGSAPVAVPTGVNERVYSVVEQAAERLGLEDSSVLFDPDVTLAAAERYRDQMAEGDEPDGLDYDDYAYNDDDLEDYDRV